MAEVAELIRQIDVSMSTSGAVNEVRIIRLEHTLASDVADILQNAISGGTGNQGGQQHGPGRAAVRTGRTAGAARRQQFGQGPESPACRAESQPAAAMLRFLTVDAKGREGC